MSEQDRVGIEELTQRIQEALTAVDLGALEGRPEQEVLLECAGQGAILQEMQARMGIVAASVDALQESAQELEGMHHSLKESLKQVTGELGATRRSLAAMEAVLQRIRRKLERPADMATGRMSRLEAPVDGEAAGAALDGLKITLVDDDRLAVAMLGRTLRRRGCAVTSFEDPLEALEAISKDPPQALILDMEMPKLSGIELARRLAPGGTELDYPILMISSVEEEEKLREAYRVGVREYLIKPVTEAELVVRIEKAVAEAGG